MAAAHKYQREAPWLGLVGIQAIERERRALTARYAGLPPSVAMDHALDELAALAWEETRLHLQEMSL